MDLADWEERNNEFEYISLEAIQLKQSERGKKNMHVHAHTQKRNRNQ